MISHLPKSPVARFAAGLLTGLMLLGGPPLEALQGHVVLVPRESPPEWLAPWLESPWLEVDSWQGMLEQAGGGVPEGGVPVSRRPTGDPGFSPWAQILTPLRGAAFQALGGVAAFSGAAFNATDLASGPDNQLTAEKSVESGQRELPLRRVERQARRAEAGSLPSLRSVESAVVAAPPQRIAAGMHAIAPEIVSLAESLGNSPAAIYAAVYDQVDFDPKWGADSPPLQTWWEKTGTSWDQAWLLQELLVAAGVDARLEWGEVEVSPELLTEITGVEDPLRAGDLMATAGHQILLVLGGNQVLSARFQHVWVKAFLDFEPDRGIENVEPDTWIRLDPSLKLFDRDPGTRYDQLVPFELGQHLSSGTTESPRATYEAALLAYAATHGGPDYDYDDLYRLTAETVTQGGAPRWSNTFVYDPVGNRLSQARVEPGGAARNIAYTYDQRDRLTTEDTLQYGWDPNGNLISKSGSDGATHEWDFENRLKKVTLASGMTVEHTYDVDGTRVKTVTTPAGGPAQVVEYLVDTSGNLSQVVLEGSSTTNISAYYVRGDDLISVIRPQTEGPSVVREYHADGLGSIRALTDETGVVTDTWQFEAFGVVVAHAGSDPNAYLFAGEMLDPNTGWAYHRARWMDPKVGRFGTKDLFEGILRDPYSLHSYLYVGNSPASFSDPTGYFGGVAEANIAGSIATTLASIKSELGFHLIAGIEGGEAGLLSSIKFAALFGVAGIVGQKLIGALSNAIGGVVRRGVSFIRGVNKPIYVITHQLPYRLAELRGLTNSRGQPLVGVGKTAAQGLLDLGRKGRSEVLAISGKYGENFPSPQAGNFGVPKWADSVDFQDHAERKILAHLRKELNSQDTGVLVITVNHPTGGPPCGAHCAPDLEAFARDFPGIRLVVQVVD